MHAYLIVGKNKKEKTDQINLIKAKIKSRLYPFKIDKIEEVRDLEKFTKLKIDEPTTILIEDIDKASPPALNALLKSLEEPQEGLSYILTCQSIYDVTPTIASRCQVVRLKSGLFLEEEKKTQIENFFKNQKGYQLSFINQIKKREDAQDFMQAVMVTLYEKLHKGGVDQLNIAKVLEQANVCYLALKANGNVTLQLTNFVISI